MDLGRPLTCVISINEVNNLTSLIRESDENLSTRLRVAFDTNRRQGVFDIHGGVLHITTIELGQIEFVPEIVYQYLKERGLLMLSPRCHRYLTHLAVLGHDQGFIQSGKELSS